MKKLSDYKKRDNGFCDYEMDGISYQDAEGLLVCGFLDFCGCGMPEEVLELMYEVLKNIDFDIDWDTRHKRDEELMPTDAIKYTVWNVLNNKGMLEHGSSLPGWKTEKGMEFQELLGEYLESQKKNIKPTV